MPAIKLTSETSLSPQECFSRIAKMFESDKELRKLDPQFKCQFDEKSLSGTAEGKQFKAQLLVQPISTGSAVQIEVTLPFHLGLVKGLVQKTLEKKLSAVLA
jgi:hypothetical protein